MQSEDENGTLFLLTNLLVRKHWPDDNLASAFEFWKYKGPYTCFL